MSKVATLGAGAGVDTVINLSYVPEFIQIGSSSDNVPITDFSVAVSGRDIINIVGNALISAYAKWLLKTSQTNLGAQTIPSVLKIGDGLVSDKTAQVSMTNAGGTTPDIFAWSTSQGSELLTAGTETLQALSNRIFEAFEALMFDPVNVDYADVVYVDGTIQKMEVSELQAMAAFSLDTEQNGMLSSILVVDNIDGRIERLNLRAAAGGSVNVLVVQ